MDGTLERNGRTFADVLFWKLWSRELSIGMMLDLAHCILIASSLLRNRRRHHKEYTR